MCYDISFLEKMKTLTALFPTLVFDEDVNMDFELDHILGHSYSAYPVIYKNNKDNVERCSLMEWGCIPFYITDEEGFKKQRASMLNARGERILGDDKSYWYKIRNRRCLIPVTGFYEHRNVKGFKNKIPYHISLKRSSLFYLAGLYSVTNVPDKETGELIERKTFTIVTTAANSIMQQIHNNGVNAGRMPLLLNDHDCVKWIEHDLPREDLEKILSFQMPVADMVWHPVFSIRTAKQREDGKLKNEIFDWPGLAELMVG